MTDTSSDGGFGSDASSFDSAGADLTSTFDGLQTRSNNLLISTNGFARAMSQAFVSATAGGKQLDNVMQTLALRISNMAVSAALRPVTSGITGGLNQLFSGLFGGSDSAGANVAAATGAIKPFATGGVIGTPTYFPMTSGGVGLAGEAGPEAIVPLRRGSDGRLGVATDGGASRANVSINISTPDAESFRRSEVYLTGQIARAVARGQRGQ
jgi:phage-related minor tail protein